MKQARKALRALRGLVRLQAIVRGRAVRRQLISLKRLPSNRKGLTEFMKRSISTTDVRCNGSEKKHLSMSKGVLDEKEITVSDATYLIYNKFIFVVCAYVHEEEKFTKNEKNL